MIKIDLLKNHSDAISTLVSLWYENLGKRWLPDVTLKEINDWYSEWLNDSVPTAYVALDNGKMPVGSCSLQWSDGIRSDLYPWLGDLVVCPKYQGQGVGTSLVRFVMQQAREMGFKKLYLFTFDESLISYYSKLGWCAFGKEVYENNLVILMSVDLSLSKT